jgi:hypothetical protein
MKEIVESEGKIIGIHCPYKGHFKHLIVCALECPLPGGNKKCSLFKLIEIDEIDRCIEEYRKERPKIQMTEKKQEEKAAGQLYVYVLHGMSKIVKEQQLADLPPDMGYLFELGKRVNLDEINKKAQPKDTSAAVDETGGNVKRRGRPAAADSSTHDAVIQSTVGIAENATASKQEVSGTTKATAISNNTNDKPKAAQPVAVPKKGFNSGFRLTGK